MLPVYDIRDQFLAAIDAGRNVVLSAPAVECAIRQDDQDRGCNYAYFTLSARRDEEGADWEITDYDARDEECPDGADPGARAGTGGGLVGGAGDGEAPPQPERVLRIDSETEDTLEGAFSIERYAGDDKPYSGTFTASRCSFL